MNIPKISAGDLLELKKKHPCGSSLFEVLRTGSDIRIVCRGCGRDLVLPREKLEKAIRRIRPAIPAQPDAALTESPEGRPNHV